MKIDVYDSYARTYDGRLIHFDVLVEPKSSKEEALKYGLEWLNEIGESSANLEQAQCNFCHSTNATPEMERSIRNNQYFIIPLEGCPAPV